MGRILQSAAAMSVAHYIATSERADMILTSSGHKVSAERLKAVADNINNIVIVTGDADTIVNPDRSKDLHDMLPVCINNHNRAVPALQLTTAATAGK